MTNQLQDELQTHNSRNKYQVEVLAEQAILEDKSFNKAIITRTADKKTEFHLDEYATNISVSDLQDYLNYKILQDDTIIN
jgi:hypothetical protein